MKAMFHLHLQYVIRDVTTLNYFGSCIVYVKIRRYVNSCHVLPRDTYKVYCCVSVFLGACVRVYSWEVQHQRKLIRILGSQTSKDKAAGVLFSE